MTKVRKVGLPSGGTTGQVLKKTTGTNFDTEWGNASGGATNLSYDPATRVVSSDTGTDATLTLADVTNPGLLTSADFTKLSNTSGTNTGDNATNTQYSGLAASKLDTNGNGSALTGLTKSQVGLGSVVNSDTTTTANITDSANKRFVTDAQQTVIGNTSGTNTGDNAVNSNYSGLAASKQDTLVSATNIKTINGSSVLGSGDLVVTGSQPDIPLTKIAPTANQTITAGYSGFISCCYEIGNGLSLEIGNMAFFEIG